MSKMLFNDPLIFRGPINPDPDPTPIVVPGSGQGGIDPVACSYSSWLQNSRFDYDNDGDYDEADYVAWWKAMIEAGYSGFTSEAFNALNPGWTGGSPFTP